MTVYYVQCAAGENLSNSKTIGLWVAGDNTFGVCVIVVNIVLIHRLNLFDTFGMLLYVFSIGSFFLFLWIESKMLLFPKVFGTFENALGDYLIWCSLFYICLQTSAIEKLWDIIVNRNLIFDNSIKKEF